MQATPDTSTTAPASAPPSRRILLAGCGALGGMIGQALATQHQVWGLRRQTAPISAPIQPLAGDLSLADLGGAQLPQQLDYVIYCLTPSSNDAAAYRMAYVTGLQHLLSALAGSAQSLRRIFFIGSSSVYHQHQDEWVDEDSETLPEGFNGQALLEAERLLGASPFATSVIRFSGIYGGHRRRLLDRVQQGLIMPGSAFTNRIHQSDCVGLVQHLLSLDSSGHPLHDCYLASDCEPVRQTTLVAWIQSQTGCQAPGAMAKKLSDAGSKRCKNQRLLDTGYCFRYPTFREGYADMLGGPDC